MDTRKDVCGYKIWAIASKWENNWKHCTHELVPPPAPGGAGDEYERTGTFLLELGIISRYHDIHCQASFLFAALCVLWWTDFIGGSRGGREGRTPPPGRPNSFDFMQFSGKFGVFTPPLEGSRPPLGKILDPPLDLREFLLIHRVLVLC